MKPLKTLIKLHKKRLDDLLVKINNLETQKDALEISLTTLKAEAETESKKYTATEYAFMLENYLKEVANQENKLSDQINNISRLIIQHRRELQTQFSELKKFEIALQNREKERENQLKKAETKSLDEFNTTQFVNGKNQ